MATYTVDITGDADNGNTGAGDLSLREAIALANANAGADTIVFASGLTGTIRLDGGDGAGGAPGGTLAITDAVTIDGGGRITISGDIDDDDTTLGGTDITDLAATAAGQLDDNVRLIDATAAITLDGLTLTGGHTLGGNERGGAIRGTAAIAIEDSILSGNGTAGASSFGGAIYGGGAVSIARSTLSDNHAEASGGGALAGNTATISDSTFNGNSSFSYGGAFTASNVTLTNTTLTGNTAGSGGGGGFYAQFADVTNSTITGNSTSGANFAGGGITIASGSFTLTNSIVLGNAAPNSDYDEIATGNQTYAGGNIVGRNDGSGADLFSGAADDGDATAANVFAQTADIGGGVLAGVLADNGGPVRTVALNASVANPALDASDVSAPAADARGLATLDHGGVGNANGGSGRDLGAFEVQEAQSLVVTTLDDVVANDGLTSLREAIAFANFDFNPDTITFDAALNGTIRLGAGGTLTTTSDLTIDGDGRIAISGDVADDDTTLAGTDITDLANTAGGNLADNVRVLAVDGAGTSLTLNGLIVTGGRTTGAFDYGGGINAEFGSLTLNGSTVSGNSTIGEFAIGGGLYAFNVTVNDSTISGNRSTGDSAGGGGMAGGNAVVTDSTVSGNSTTGAYGNGGAILGGASLSIANATVTGNATTGQFAGGGGIYASDVDVTNSTITGNTTAGSLAHGGGLSVNGDAILTNSIVLGNLSQQANNDDFLGGISTSLQGGNIVGTTVSYNGVGTGTPTSAAAVFAQTIDLGGGVLGGVLADNGGPAATVALNASVANPALDASNDTAPVADARGQAAFDVVGLDNNGAAISLRDLGAYEAQSQIEAPSLVVTTLNDVVDASDGLTSLREAIAFANAGDADGVNGAADTISFAANLSGGTIALAGGQFGIVESVTIQGDIDGDDVADITVDAHQASRAFLIDDGVSAATITATLDGLAIENGYDSDRGGAIRVANSDALIFANAGIADSNADDRGGAIFGDRDSSIQLDNATVSGNSARRGGAIAIGEDSTLELNGSTVSGNSDDGSGFGGGIFGSLSTITLNGSTVSGNTASSGGGIAAYASALTLNNSTVAGNDASYGGAIAVGDGTTIVLASSTVTGNAASIEGGGVHIDQSVGSTTLVNSIVAGNSAAAGNEFFGDTSAPLIFVGGNIFGSASDLASHTDVSGTPIFVDGASQSGMQDIFAGVVANGGRFAGVLADNGGPVQTVALNAVGANPALDASDGAAPATDARGFATVDFGSVANINGSARDLGAFEASEAPSLVVTTLADVVANDGLTSLREAIAFANAGDADGVDGAADTITFAANLSGGTITLAGGQFGIGETVTIQADIDSDDVADITIDAHRASRIFSVSDGDNTTTITATLDGLVLQNGQEAGNGGAIFIARKDALILNNSSIGGSESTQSSGGAIWADRDASVTLNHSTLSGNVSDDGGGAIDAGRDATVTLTASSITGNTGGNAGGIFAGFSASVTLTDSTVSGNESEVNGGGINVFDEATVALFNTTVSGNMSVGSGGGIFGGEGAVVTATNATITGNVSGGEGGATSVQDDALITFTNSIVAGNQGSNGTEIAGADGATLTFTGMNIVDARFAQFDVINGFADHAIGVDGGSQAAMEAIFATVINNNGRFAGILANNGGPVQTVALNTAVTNPALDASNPAAPATDARGEATLDHPDVANTNGGSGRDLGAYEVNAYPTVARADAVTARENAALSGSVFADNGSGADSDLGGPALAVSEVNGVAADVGTQIALASGAKLTLNADGTFSYDANGAFDYLPDFAASGASNTTATDSFTYTLSGGATATVTVTIRGVDSDDNVQGGAGDDTLNAGIGNDYINGRAGADAMRGGLGDDIYYVDAAGDKTIELAGAGSGNDIVYSTIGRTLSANLEVLRLLGAGHLGGKGNAGDNTILGTTGNNVLQGMAGADFLGGGDGDDRLDGGTGVDTMKGGDGNDIYYVDDAGDLTVESSDTGGTDTVYSSIGRRLDAFIEVLILQGSADINGKGRLGAETLIGNSGANVLLGDDGADTLTGNAGNDRLVGGAGADSMRGGEGDDIYVIDEAGDRAIETAGAGRDTVFSPFSYTLGSNLEDLVLDDGGAANLNGKGNGLANRIVGNAGNNLLQGEGGGDLLQGGYGRDRLLGGAGADRLEGGNDADLMAGGADNDTMDGGAGADTFRFSAAGEGDDTIEDFQLAADRFDLAGGSFSAAVEFSGTTTLTYSGGTIAIAGVTGVGLAAWNALVLPAGGMAGRAAPDAGTPGIQDAPAVFAGSYHAAEPGLPYNPAAIIGGLRPHDLLAAGHADFMMA